MKKTALLIISLLLAACTLQAQPGNLRPGDLLFFRDTAGMGAAVRESTGQYTHVAIVESAGDTVWIIDATPEHGVARRPLILRQGDPVDAYRPIARFDAKAVLDRARSFIGQPYDNAFLPDNEALYCSELIQAAYETLFPSQPMNWRDKNGDLPEYWQKHFEALGMPVPEGVPGTNPTDLSRSPLLQKL